MLFQWTPISENHFRLLRRKAPLPSGELSYQLCTFDISSAPPYVAISYVCGSPLSDQTVVVHSRSRTVSDGCLEALQQVQHHDEYEFVWIDCLCIHQANLEENSRQVRMMGQIYGSAGCVLACLGSVMAPDIQGLCEAVSELQCACDFKNL